MSDEHYTVRDVWFTREQMPWLISILGTLELGRWPAAPHELNDTTSELKPQGPHDTASGVCADVKLRLEALGQDGLMLVDHYRYCMVPRDMETRWRMWFNEIRTRMNWALDYISDPPHKTKGVAFRRRRRSYDMYISDRKYSQRYAQS